MQELRLVAVSEDGTYLVLATAGRGTRFTLPVDDRLRAAVRGHFSRLGQFEIEVESPLRPKEIQARIRSGETAEEIAESAGIPVERVRWFEGPVLQEREYMAQQAQRVAVRRPGESTPGPPLGETVEERLGRGGVDLEEVEWDSWKCEDSTWRIRLSFFDNGRPHAAEWVFDPRRRHVSPLDEVAARLTAVEWDDEALGGDTVTPLVPRRPAMKVVSDNRDFASAPPPARGIGFEPEPAAERPHVPSRPEPRPEPLRAAEPPRVNRPRIAEPPPEPRPARPSEPPVASRPAARQLQEAPQEPEERSTAPEPEEAAEAAEAAPVPAPVAKPAPEPASEAPRAEPGAPDEDAAAEPEEPAAEEREPVAEPDLDPEPADEPEAVQEDPAPETEPETEPGPAEQPAAKDEDAEGAEETEAAEAVEEPEPEPAVAGEQAPQEPESEPEPAAAEAGEPAAEEPAVEEPAGEEPVAEEPPPAAPEKPAAREKAQPPPKPQRPAHREPNRPPAKKKSTGRPTMPAAPADKPVGPPAAAAAAAGDPPSAPQRPARNRRKSKGKRASVPSWDEIMFGARRPD
ncbi:septation protein SepH [Spirillospora sp. CA-255316]